MYIALYQKKKVALVRKKKSEYRELGTLPIYNTDSFKNYILNLNIILIVIISNKWIYSDIKLYFIV